MRRTISRNSSTAISLASRSDAVSLQIRHALKPCSSIAASRSSGVLSRMRRSPVGKAKITAPVVPAVPLNDAYCSSRSSRYRALIAACWSSVSGWLRDGHVNAARALEHGQVLRHLGQLGDRLHPRRTRPHDADALAVELDACFGPQARLHDRALELVDARPRRAVGRRESTGRHDREPSAELLAGLGVEHPGVGLLVERHRAHTGGETDVATKVVAIGEVVQVPLDLRLRREVLGPDPLLLELGVEAERVLEARDVAPSAGIAVPEPRAADPGALLQHEHAEALLAQDLQCVQARHPRADDHDIRVEHHGSTLRRHGPRPPVCASRRPIPVATQWTFATSSSARDTAPPLVEPRRTSACRPASNRSRR